MVLRFLFFWLLPFQLLAQTERPILSGKVLDSKTQQPIAKASVFFSNTAKGMVTDSEGNFAFDKLPGTNLDLVISCVGYQTFSMAIRLADLPKNYQVMLEPKTNELAEVVLEPVEPNGWQRYGSFFKESFIGTSSLATDCEIQNPEVLKFRYSRKMNKLTVTATAPLVIEHKALGYTIEYQLELFEYHYQAHALFYFGFPFFKDWSEANGKLTNRWRKNRQFAYAGSFQHFIASVYAKKLVEEDFEVLRLVKKPNFEKQRVKSIMQKRRRVVNVDSMRKLGRPIILNTLIDSIKKDDSAIYYQSVMQQPDEYNILGKEFLTADSLLVVQSDTLKSIFFDNYIVVTYRGGREEQNYLNQTMQGGRLPYWQKSTIRFIEPKPIIIYANGYYFSPQYIMNDGYWGWREKIAMLLPLDYMPAKKN
jgi:hypothetical protein